MRALALLAVLLVLCVEGALADEIRKEGNVWYPETIKKGEILPVLLVFDGGAPADFIDLEHLAKSQRIAVVHVKHGGVLGGRERGRQVDVRIALSEASRVLPQIAQLPCVLGGFGQRGNHAYGFLRNMGVQGVVVAKPTIRGFQAAGSSPLPEQKGVRLLLLESEPTEDSTTKGVLADVAKAGIEATAEHIAKGDSLPRTVATRVGAFLKTFVGERVEGRKLLRLDARESDYETIQTEGADGLQLTADVYRAKDKQAPVIVLFHQARSSRGEYRRIAPTLVSEGYNVLAVDQRSGDKWGDIDNESAKRAKDKGLAANYIDARPDLDRAVAWARELGLKGTLAIVGSSYSSSLAVFVAADNKEVSAVVSFSPGDYLPPRGSIVEAAKRLTKPALVVCPPREERQAKQVFDPIASKHKQLYVQPEGVHGASTLDRSPTYDEAWGVFLGFLKAHVK